VVQEARTTIKDPKGSGIERVVGLEHIETECIHLRSWASIDDATTFTKGFKKGHVLFGRRRAYLKKAALADFDGICSGDITVMEAKEGLLPELLPFLVCNDKFFDYAVKHSAGGLSPRTKFKDLANYEFLLPPKDQQAKLAQLLWAAHAVKENYEHSKKIHSIAFKAFVNDRILNQPEAAEMRLEELTYSMDGGKSPVCENETYISGTPGILKTSAVTSGKFVSSEAKPVKPKDLDSLSISVTAGSILINRKNTRELVGVSCYIDESFPHLFLSDLIWQIRPNEKVLSKYLFYLLSSTRIRNQFSALSNGTSSSMVNISKGNVAKVRLSVPAIEQQKSILVEVERFEQSSELLNQATSDSKQFLKSLINQIL
jgi:type I restriction enzyme S subunit